MSAVALETRPARTWNFWDSTIGKKAVMAVTGVILFGFLVSHMAANLQVFLGPEYLNHYAVALREIPVVLWIARSTLLISVVLHIIASIQLTALKNAARPIAYVKKKAVVSSYASRTMMWSGPIVAAFIVYHLLHFTIGSVHPDFEDLKPYENVVRGFRVIPVTIAYIVAVSLLGMHLYHGLWSMFQTLGASHPRYTPAMKRFAALGSVAITVGFISVPVAVLLGVVA